MGMARCGADVALLDVPSQADKLEKVAAKVRSLAGRPAGCWLAGSAGAGAPAVRACA